MRFDYHSTRRSGSITQWARPRLEMLEQRNAPAVMSTLGNTVLSSPQTTTATPANVDTPATTSQQTNGRSATTSQQLNGTPTTPSQQLTGAPTTTSQQIDGTSPTASQQGNGTSTSTSQQGNGGNNRDLFPTAVANGQLAPLSQTSNGTTLATSQVPLLSSQFLSGANNRNLFQGGTANAPASALNQNNDATTIAGAQSIVLSRDVSSRLTRGVYGMLLPGGRTNPSPDARPATPRSLLSPIGSGAEEQEESVPPVRPLDLPEQPVPERPPTPSPGGSEVVEA